MNKRQVAKMMYFLTLRDMSISDLAKKLGLKNPDSVRKRMRGPIEWNAKEIRKVSLILNLTPEDVIDIFIKEV